MKRNKLIIIDADSEVHENISHIFTHLKQDREIISYFNQLDALSIFTFFHYLNESDIIFIDLALSERIVNILSTKIINTAKSPQLYLTSSCIDFEQITQCHKHEIILDYFPKPIIADDTQTMVA